MHLVGIARLASISPILEAKRAVTYRQLPTRSYIHKNSGNSPYFQWGINPYRGCEFGCKYCYARYTHEFMELRSPEDFELRIFAKQFSAAAFRKELNGIRKSEHIAIGTATDPYQPAERRFRVTRSILEVFAAESGRRFSITTKSDLVARDADLLSRIARANVVHVNMTVTTMDRELARLMEPRAPRPDLRVDALQRLISRGVSAGVFAAPLLPGINDSVESIREVAKAAAHAGAQFFSGGVVFLKPCSQQVMFPFLKEHYPHLLRHYEKTFGKSAFLRGEVPDRIYNNIEAVRKEFRMGHRPAAYVPPEDLEPQLSLFANL